MKSWCKVGAFLVKSWCKVGAFLVKSWCKVGAFLVHSWCKVFTPTTLQVQEKEPQTLHQECTNFAPTFAPKFPSKKLQINVDHDPRLDFFLRKDVLCGWLLGAVESKGLL